MRKLMMTSASIALIVGVAACSSTPEPEPVVVDEPEVVVVEEPEEVVVVEETLPVVHWKVKKFIIGGCNHFHS